MHSAWKTKEDLLTFVRTSKMPLLEPRQLSVVWKIRVSSKIQSEMDLTKSEIDLPKKYESQPQMIWKADYLGQLHFVRLLLQSDLPKCIRGNFKFWKLMESYFKKPLKNFLPQCTNNYCTKNYPFNRKPLSLVTYYTRYIKP